jgi:hypothetical protein
MKKMSIILITVTLLLACKKEINITPPTILIENMTASVLDSVTIKVEEYASIDGERIIADYYTWTIENSDGKIQADSFPDAPMIYWIPQKAGYYLVKVKIGYDNNKSITTIKEITIKESTLSLQNKMVGHWKGKGTRYYFEDQWAIDVYFDSTGHYYGTADYYSFDPYCEKGVFNTERLDYLNNNELVDCGTPGNIACQRIAINKVVDNKGFGYVNIGNESVDVSNIMDTVTSFSCSYMYDLYNLEFSNNDKILKFEFMWSYGVDDAWFKKIELVRQ